MAIALDAAAAGADGFVSNSISWSHTCTGSNLILFVGYCGQQSHTPTGATYNGVSMTAISTYSFANSVCVLYYLLNPATGTNTVAVNGSAMTGSGLSASYTGAKQSGVPDASTTTGQVAITSRTATVTTIADNCWTVLAGGTESSQSPGASTGSTSRGTRGANGYGLGLFDSNAAKTPAGSTSMTWTVSSSATMLGVMASFAPAAAAASTTEIRLQRFGRGMFCGAFRGMRWRDEESEIQLSRRARQRRKKAEELMRAGR